MSNIGKFNTSIGSIQRRAGESITSSLSRSSPRTFLGNEKSSRDPVIFTRKQRRHHTHIIGSTGTGKSKFMELLLRKDVIDRRAGVCLIDPHGSLYEDMMTYISHRYPNHADRIILFNPAQDLDKVIGFNPIPSPVKNLDYLLDSLISGCLKAWGQDNTDDTPRISRWLENIFYTVIQNDLTLIETTALFNIHNKKNRQALTQNIKNETVLDDWITFEKLPPQQKQNMIEGASNRLRKFLRNEIIRNIIGQKDRTLDFTDITKEGHVVLINLNGQGRISNENAKLLGIMIVNEIFRCAKLRDPRDPHKKPFFFYLDEFANFITKDIARSLEETRKFGLFMVLAHQHLAQLQEEDEYLYSSVMTNCNNKVVFGGLSHEDSELMMKEVSTGFMNLKSVKEDLYSTKEKHELKLVETKNRSESESTSRSWSDSIAKTLGISKTTGVSNTTGTSETNGTTIGSGQSSTTNQSSGFSNGTSKGKDHKTANTSFNSASGTSNSHSTNQSQSNSVSHSQSLTKSESESHSESTSTSEQKGGSEGKSHSTGVSESYINLPTEYKELSSRAFWSLQELQYMETALIKNQDTAQAFIKVGTSEPIKMDVAHIQDIAYSPRNSPKRIERFRDQVFLSHPHCYKTLPDIKQEREDRQRAVFDDPLNYGENTTLPSETNNDKDASQKSGKHKMLAEAETPNPTSTSESDDPFA